MRGLRRRTGLLLLVSMALFSLSFVCGAKEVRLRVGLMGGLISIAGQDGGWLHDVVRDFEADNPNIKIEIEPVAGNYTQKIPAAIAAGVAPDVIQGWGDTQRSWAESGWLLDLEPFLQRLYPKASKDFFPAQWNALRLTDGPRAGMRYGIPMYVNVMGGILYNADMFDEAGLIYPEQRKSWTWDDLLGAAKKLTRANDDENDHWGFVTLATNTPWVDSWMWGAGGGLMAADNPRVFTGDSPESIAGLSFLHSLVWEHGVMPPDPWTIGGPQKGFLGGDVAMIQTYSSWTEEIYSNAEFNWNIAPNPIGPNGYPAAVTVTDSFSVYGETKHPEEAVRFAMALASRKANLGRLRAPFYQMPSMPGLGGEYFKLMPEKNLWVYLKSMEHARVDCRVFFPKPVEMNQILVNTWNKVIAENETTPALGMRAVADSIRALLK